MRAYNIILLGLLGLCHGEGGGRPLLDFLRKRLVGEETNDIMEIFRLKTSLSTMMGKCYNTAKVQQAMMNCGGSTNDDFSVKDVFLDGKLSNEERDDIKMKIMNKMKNKDVVCASEKLGIIKDGKLNALGIEKFIRQIVIDPKLTERVVEVGEECTQLVTGCNISGLEEQTIMHNKCIKSRMFQICIKSMIEEKLGFDPKFDF